MFAARASPAGLTTGKALADSLGIQGQAPLPPPTQQREPRFLLIAQARLILCVHYAQAGICELRPISAVNPYSWTDNVLLLL